MPAYMSAGQVHAARLHPARIIETRIALSPDWFLDWAFEEVQRIAEGSGQYVLTARVSVDLSLQQAAHDALVNTLGKTGSKRRTPFSGALVAMEPDGAVRAIVGGLDYDDSQFKSRHARAPAARLVLQALRLCHGFRERLQSALDRARRFRSRAATGAPGTTVAAAGRDAR